MFNQPLSYFIFCFVLCTSAFSQAVDSTQLYYQQVLYPTETSHLPSGYFYYAGVAETYLNRGDTLFAIDAQHLAAMASYKLGSYTASEQEAVEALQWLDALAAPPETKNSRYAGLYNHLGLLYGNKNHHAKALDYYKLTLTHVASASDSITAFNNRGKMYMEMGEYQAAARELLQAVQMSKKEGDTSQIARAINNLGVLKLRQNNKEGASDLRQALQLRRQINDLEGIYSSNRHLAFFALSEKDTAMAKTFAAQTLSIAHELNSPSYLLESLSILMDLKNDTLVARYKTLTDSINRANQEEQNLYAAMRFDVEKEILNTRQALLNLEKERNQKILILIIGILLVGLFVLLIMIIFSRIKRIKQAEVLKTEIRFSKKVHDEVANEVYQVMVKMQVNPQKEDILDHIEHIYIKSRDISKEYQVLDPETPFNETLTDLLNSYQSDLIKIMVHYTNAVDWKQLSRIQKQTVYRVLQELMTNMKKHSKATLVVVRFIQNGGKLEVRYSDNGVGASLHKQNGLQNAENRIFAINGSITFETEPNKGFKVTFII